MSDRNASPPGSSNGSEGSAQDKARDVAGQAQEKARGAAAKAQETVQQQVDERTNQAGEKISGTADDVRSVAGELRKQGKDGPAKLADQAADQAEKVGSYLSGTGPEKMLHDVEDFGRERPWALLAGGLALGAVAARFLKASSRNRYQQQGSGSAGGYKGGAPYSTGGDGSTPKFPSTGPPVSGTVPPVTGATPPRMLPSEPVVQTPPPVGR